MWYRRIPISPCAYCPYEHFIHRYQWNPTRANHSPVSSGAVLINFQYLARFNQPERECFAYQPHHVSMYNKQNTIWAKLAWRWLEFFIIFQLITAELELCLIKATLLRLKVNCSFRACFSYISVNTKHLYDICTTLDQRQRRWTAVVQMLYKCFVFTRIRVRHLISHLYIYLYSGPRIWKNQLNINCIILGQSPINFPFIAIQTYHSCNNALLMEISPTIHNNTLFYCRKCYILNVYCVFRGNLQDSLPSLGRYLYRQHAVRRNSAGANMKVIQNHFSCLWTFYDIIQGK